MPLTGEICKTSGEYEGTCLNTKEAHRNRQRFRSGRLFTACPECGNRPDVSSLAVIQWELVKPE